MTLQRINLGLDTSGRPLIVDDRTLAKLRAAEAALGFAFTIVQGSWSDAEASAGTHTGGGVIDLRTWNLPASIPPAEAVEALRRAGLIAWYRTPAQGFDPHIHAIDYGNPELAPSAARQVEAWEAGRNGLASSGPDDGARVPIPKNPPREQDVLDMDKDELATLVQDAVRGIEVPMKRGNVNKPVRLPIALRELEETQDRILAELAAIREAVEAK